MSALSGFNNVLLRTVDRIARWYPDLKDMKTIYRAVDTLKKYNPRLVLDQFMEAVAPYYIQVFHKEETFFKRLDEVDPALVNNETVEGESETYMDKFLVFRTLWETMPDDRKKYIWKMFIALLKVGAVASNNPAHQQILDYVRDHPELFEEPPVQAGTSTEPADA